MAAKYNVLLGFPDEEITLDHADQVDFTTNKIGGLPDWTGLEVPASELACSICNSKTSLICQIYAPLENTAYHRTFYVLACLRSCCWNNSNSWTCLRSQRLAEWATCEEEENNGISVDTKATDWLDEADDWGSEDDDNGNPIGQKMGNLAISDDEDSSIGEMSNFRQTSPKSAAARSEMTSTDEATAEIETDDGENVVAAESLSEDVLANNTAISQLFRLNVDDGSKSRSGHFAARFLNVYAENRAEECSAPTEHERRLLVEYKAKEAMAVQSEQGKFANDKSAADGYEKVAPRHGDVGFHKFLSAINANPGQVVRYSRDAPPLFMNSRPEKLSLPKSCRNCGSAVICEIQILPTLIASLKLVSTSSQESHALRSSDIEFGNVLVYTCAKSCWNDGKKFMSEQVFVEPEL